MTEYGSKPSVCSMWAHQAALPPLAPPPTACMSPYAVALTLSRWLQIFVTCCGVMPNCDARSPPITVESCASTVKSRSVSAVAPQMYPMHDAAPVSPSPVGPTIGVKSGPGVVMVTAMPPPGCMTLPE